MAHAIMDTVQYNEREEAIIQSLLEGLQHAATVRLLHFWLIFILHNLKQQNQLRVTVRESTKGPLPPTSPLLTFFFTFFPDSGSFSTFSTSVMK